LGGGFEGPEFTVRRGRLKEERDVDTREEKGRKTFY